MAEITASLVKELRERTGAGMMECKKALTENNGDIDTATEWLRKSGLAKADKKADRIAAEGRIAVAQDGGKAVLVEINSETDFVAKDENFIAFADAVAAGRAGLRRHRRRGAEGRQAGVRRDRRGNPRRRRSPRSARTCRSVASSTVDSANNIAAYVHGGTIGVLVELKGGDAELARGIAMHVAAMNPPYIKASDVPAEFVAKEKEIELAKMTDKDKAKPADILEKIISGKIAKIVNEVTLYGQPYVLDTNQTVEQVLKAAGARCRRLPAPRRRRRHREGGGRLRRRSDEAGRPGVSHPPLRSKEKGRERSRPFSFAHRGMAPRWGRVWRSHPGLLQKGPQRQGPLRSGPAGP